MHAVFALPARLFPHAEQLPLPDFGAYWKSPTANPAVAIECVGRSTKVRVFFWVISDHCDTVTSKVSRSGKQVVETEHRNEKRGELQ
nr:hypothetical protein Iba_chr02cCG12150 [Ipomoea batatas]